ncbi:VOC family protein [Conexibacter sp. JD483]|uniref:VOC family protein n=1 Tax=unclassified Conexibacter TaxID=2627773 RepID=UPI00271B39CA|nr:MULTISPECIES: VOC family protein [unclassified Conexibacter]MDO8185996.1 VOC family protein [Conexibacter sp. CPCC 205706]MDO8199486.1 VOC family protein [Conexibacter sp. CPCC 205762]MDR9368979.1 VOC family protein [Conexibacter sp. JD483]
MDATAAAAQESAAATLGRLAGVTVAVPDPAATAAFLGDGIGFAVESLPGGDVAVRCEGDYGPRGQTAVVLRQAQGGAESQELLAITWEVADGYDFAALAVRAAEAGATTTETPAGGLALADPAGNPLVVEPAAAHTVAPPAPGLLGPRRLGHINVKSDAPPRSSAFFQRVLGLKLSEQIGDNLFFLRIGAEHHNLGIRPGERGMLHHLGCELAGWHAYQPILDRLAAHGWKVEYGPGRHVPGRNLFTYVVDPSSGLRVELFADMAQIADERGHEPVRWEAGDRMTKTINTWGPTPPASFLA